MSEGVNGIGGIGDTFGMRHHNDTFTELMSGMPQKINHLISHFRIQAASRFIRQNRAARPPKGATRARPTATR